MAEKSKNNFFKTMGVMNLTPDSFSDGGKLIRTETALKVFQSYAGNCDIVDIGAESTAPFNQSIGPEEELERLSGFFRPLFNAVEDPGIALSIDTYRPKVFLECAGWLRKRWPKSELIFNDVSGVIDHELESALSQNLEFSYVFSHNLCGSRNKTGDHMNFVSKAQAGRFVAEVGEFFQSGLEKLQCFNKRIILDPCFGFSKTREQNHYLLKNFRQLVQKVGEDKDFLAGISRKSFMRFPKGMDPKHAQNQDRLDHSQTALLFNLLQQNQNSRFIFRVHNPNALSGLRDALKIIRV